MGTATGSPEVYIPDKASIRIPPLPPPYTDSAPRRATSSSDKELPMPIKVESPSEGTGAASIKEDLAGPEESFRYAWEELDLAERQPGEVADW
jgi:hypothetical protein